MTPKEIHAVSQLYLSNIDSFKLKKKSEKTYINNDGFTLEFQLNKYGFIPRQGCEFLVYVTDPRVIDQWGVVDYTAN